MTTQILTTKLYIPPPRPSLISRRRLLEQLKAGLDRKLILISAPAGYGKTTLLSELVSQSEFPFCWLSLDKQDNDLEGFLSYLIASLQSINIGVDEQILDLYQPHQSDNITSLLIPLINQISAVERRHFLVLDDYHLIENQEIHETLIYFLDHLPPNLRLVIISRVDPPLRLAYLRARDEMCEIRAVDLRFSVEEAQNFLNQSMGLDLAHPDVTTLTQKTEGWIAGLQLAALSLQNHPKPQEFIRVYAGDDHYLMDYLLDEVLFRQSKDIQHFLLNTSILDRFSAPLCDALLDWAPGTSRVILDQIHKANLFIIPLDNRRQWYRYHHIFASLLQHRLRAQKQLSLAQLHSRASDWYLEKDLVNEALFHAILADDILKVSGLVEKNIFLAARSGERLALIDYVESQPESVLKRLPWVCIAVAWALVETGQMAKMEKFLDLAETADELPERAIGYLSVVRANHAAMLGNFDQMIRFAREAQLHARPEDQNIRGLITTLLSTSEFWMGNAPASVELLEQAYADNLEAGNYNQAIMNLTEAGQIQVVMGTAYKGLQTLQKANELAEEIKRSSGRRPIASAYTRLVLGDINTELGEIEVALPMIQDGLHQARLWGQPEILYLGYQFLSKVLIETGDFEGAHLANRQSRKYTTYEGTPSTWTDRALAYEAQIHLRRGNLSRVSQILDEIGVKASDPVRFDKTLVGRTLSKYLILSDQFDDAIRITANLADAAHAAGAPIHTMKALILKAVAHHLKGESENALASLEPALFIAAGEGLLVQAFVTEGEPMAQLIYEAATRGIYPEFCRKLLARFSARTQPAVRQGGKLLEALSGREIEVLQCIAQGCTNQEIALQLHLSLYTVKSHARNIYSKLGVKNRTEAVAKARLLGLLPQG